MPCSFGLLPHARSEAGVQSNGLPEVTVVVRWIPLVPAAYGTRVARPARTTMLVPGGNGSQLGRRMRPALGDHCIVGKSPEGSQPWVGRLALQVACLRRPRSGSLGAGTCSSIRHSATASARCCTSFVHRYGPSGTNGPVPLRPPPRFCRSTGLSAETNRIEPSPATTFRASMYLDA
jgi:hypothetical protein